MELQILTCVLAFVISTASAYEENEATKEIKAAASDCAQFKTLCKENCRNDAFVYCAKFDTEWYWATRCDCWAWSGIGGGNGKGSGGSGGGPTEGGGGSEGGEEGGGDESTGGEEGGEETTEGGGEEGGEETTGEETTGEEGGDENTGGAEEETGEETGGEEGTDDGEEISVEGGENGKSGDKTGAGSGFMNEILAQHNMYRKKHAAPAMSIDNAAVTKAQGWADKLAERDSIGHNPERGDFGENVYMAFGKGVDAKAPVDSWYDEVKQYDFSNQGFASGTGHFTQVVWKGSTGLGCAQAKASSGSIYVVCNYSPPGNMMGAFEDNVAPES